MEGRHIYTHKGTPSPRELEALKLLAEGLTNKEVAIKLEISMQTVKNMLVYTRDKLSAKNSTEAICICLKRGLI